MSDKASKHSKKRVRFLECLLALSLIIRLFSYYCGLVPHTVTISHSTTWSGRSISSNVC